MTSETSGPTIKVHSTSFNSLVVTSPTSPFPLKRIAGDPLHPHIDRFIPLELPTVEPLDKDPMCLGRSIS